MFLFKAHDQTSRRRQISRATVQDTETVRKQWKEWKQLQVVANYTLTSCVKTCILVLFSCVRLQKR